jgi:ferrochelatase
LSDGVLLVNLGTPEAPEPGEVRRFLAEFLSDPRVVALPRILWLPILYGAVLPLRSARSAHKYASIWSAAGSPLAVHTARQAQLLGERLGRPVRHAMRYGAPRIAEALGGLRAAGCARVRVVPLYPQYARSTTESVRDCLAPEVEFVADFHDHPAYIGALAALLQRHWSEHGRAKRLLMSFHGLPQRAVDQGDPYEKQCLATARLLGERLGLEQAEYRVTFQSRFGAAKWLQPYTEATLIELARAGAGEVDVVCPGFVSDCLETLEEIGIGARETFRAAGGRELRLVPCLNESPEWIEALAAIAEGC